MILREITVKGVKCFRDEVTLGRFGEGLNMIFGPNEMGKSTLIEATARALFDGYTVTGDAIESLQPWGSTLAPEMTLEFEARGERWRLEKRLLSGPECTLSRMESSGWSRLHERDAADEFVRELMHGDAPGRGPSDLRHWGLARTLWCLHDPCMVGRAEAACVVPSAVASQLRSVLGEGTVATALDAVSDRLGSRYDEHFTPERGDPKAGSPIKSLQEELDTLEEQRGEAERELERVEAAAERLEALEEEAESLEEERERLREQIEDYREEAEQVADLQREIEGIETELERARSDRDDVAEDLQRLREAREAADEARDELEEVDEGLAEVEGNLKVARRLVEEAQEDHRKAQEVRKRAARSLERARKIDRTLSLLDDRQSLTASLAEIEELAEERDELEERLQEMPCPDDDEVERAASLQRRIESLQTQLETSGLTATIEARREQEVALSGGEDEVREMVAEGGELSYSAGASLEIDLPQVARIRVRSGASEPAELQAELADAREARRELLAPYGADDAAELRDLQREHERLSEDLARHDERMQQAADPWEGPEDIETRRAEVRLELRRLLNELELTEDELVGMDRPDVSGLEDAFRAAQADEDAIQETLEDRRGRAEELAGEREELREERARLDAAVGEHQATVTGVLERHDCDDEGELQSRLDGAEREVDEREAALDERRAKLPSEETDPQRLMETAEQALEDVNEREMELAGQRGDSQGIIDRARTEGRYEQLSHIEERLAAARRTLHETWREAQAIKLLRQLINARHSDITTGALPGLEEKVSRMLRHVTGRDRALHMGEDMAVTEVVDGETEHEPKELSSGAREQLDLVTRIALGETYAEHYGRTMMVLDDALLYTDPRRHDRVKQILQRAGDLLQVFLLTSHPERYRGIVPAECQFDLEAIRAAR